MDDLTVEKIAQVDPSVLATRRGFEILLLALQAGTIQEVDYPAAQRLRLCERLLEAACEPSETSSQSIATAIASEAAQADVWLSVAKGRKSVPVRLRSPVAANGPLPVLHPKLPLAAVALGGGNRVSQAAPLVGIRWFVAAGEEDFGRGGAVQLHQSLTAANVPSTYRVYADVEHMVIVQAAIDDVFAFLDALAP